MSASLRTLPQQKALFIDRDGIINIDYGYVYKIEDFEFSAGIFDLLKQFASAGFMLIVVTNQSGIGRGYYTEADFAALTVWMYDQFKVQGINITKVYHCPHAPDMPCNCRKPLTGMVDQAVADFNIEVKQSWMIGDKASDMQLADNAGINNKIFIGSRKPDTTSLCFTTVAAAAHSFEQRQV